MALQSFAKFLSIILGPVWLPILLAVMLFQTGLSTHQIYLLFPIILLLQFIIPFTYLYIALKLGTISVWDIPKREERYTLLAIYFVSSAISLALIRHFGNDFFFNLNLIFFVLTIAVSVITHFWKISVHTILNTAGAIILNFFFNWQLPWLFLLVPMVFWSRYKLRRHTPKQLLVGTLVSAIIILGGLFYFRYI